MTQPSPLALAIAKHVLATYMVGGYSHGDWWSIAESSLAQDIDAILLPRLNTWADAMEEALTDSVDARGTCYEAHHLPPNTRGALRQALKEIKPS